MKKKTPLFFFCSLFALLAFTFLIFFGESTVFSLKENVYKKKLISLQGYYENELNVLNENVSQSLKEAAFLSWLKKKLATVDFSFENVLKSEREQSVEIVDYFLVNLVVLNPRGKVIYAYDSLPLEETDFYQISFIRPEVFSIENNNTLLLTLQTEHLMEGNGRPLPPGYVLFYFDLRDLARRVFSFQEQEFLPGKMLSYRYSFVYNESNNAGVQTSLAAIINKSFDLHSKWKRVHIKKSSLSFQAYRLNSGINFAYLYNSNVFGIPFVSIVGFSLLVVNLLLSVLLLVFYRGGQIQLEGKRGFFIMRRKFFVVLRSPLWIFYKFFKKGAYSSRKLQIPTSVYGKKAKKQEKEIVSLLQSLDGDDEELERNVGTNAEDFWKNERINEIGKALYTNEKKIVKNSNWIPELKQLFTKYGWMQNDDDHFGVATNASSGMLFLAVLRKEKKIWNIHEFMGAEIETVRRFKFDDNDALVNRYLQKGQSVFISKKKKISKLLQVFLAPQDYERFEGVMFYPVMHSVEKDERENYGEVDQGESTTPIASHLQAIIVLA